MSKRIETLQNLVGNAISKIQTITIQATDTNIMAINEAAGSLMTVYNTLRVMNEEKPEGVNEDGGN